MRNLLTNLKSEKSQKKNKIGDKQGYTLTPSLKIEVRPAGGKGRGVFASQDIKRGEIVEIAPTIYVPDEQYGYLTAAILANYVFSAHDEEGSVVALGYASLYNHSSNANADWNMNKDSIVIRALSDIKAGSEITLDYGWDDEDLKERGITDEA